MPQDDDHTFSGVGRFSKDFPGLAGHPAMLQHHLIRNSQGFKSLEKKVAQVLIKFFAKNSYFGIAFFRKYVSQVLQNDLLPIADDVIQQDINQVRYKV